MAELDPQLFQDVECYLRPNLTTRDERTAALTYLLSQWPGQTSLRWDAPADAFTAELVHRLPNAMVIDVLNSIASRLGVEQQQIAEQLCLRVATAGAPFHHGPQPAVQLKPEQLPNQHHSRARARHLRLSRDGHAVECAVGNGLLRPSRQSISDPEVVVAADASLIACRAADRIRVARVNRVTGSVAEWSHTIDLTDLDNGELLAVGAAGPSDVAFVWATCPGTDLVVARRVDGIPERVACLSDRCASSAVLHRGRVLLAAPAGDRSSTECSAFPDVDIDSLIAVSAYGQTLVLALGIDTEGRPGAWVEINGRQRARSYESDVYLELKVGGRTPPAIVTRAGLPAELSSEQDSDWPYEHWVSYAFTDMAPTA